MHLWIAHELPAGAPRGGSAALPLTVTLAPSASGVPPAPARPTDPVAGEASTRQRPVPASAPFDAAPARRLAQPRPDGAAPVAHDDPTYYPARQLDVYPALLAPLSIRYPEPAVAEASGGRVLVIVLIDATGRVEKAAVAEADPPGYFDEAARSALASAAFSAARRNGVPVRSRVLIQVNFDPKDAAAAAATQ